MTTTTVDVSCRTCGWESAQPPEFQRVDGQHHADQETGHEVRVTTTTVELLPADPAAARARPGEDVCPECNYGIHWHGGWGGPKGCTLTDNGVARRVAATRKAEQGSAL